MREARLLPEAGGLPNMVPACHQPHLSNPGHPPMALLPSRDQSRGYLSAMHPRWRRWQDL